MRRTILSNWLNSHMQAQFFVVLMPALMICIYAFAYCIDMLGIASAYANNDKAAADARAVDSIWVDDDGACFVSVPGVVGQFRFDGADLHFCTELPTDDLYYDVSDGEFVKNISSDYALLFVVRSNILTVLFSMTVYAFLLKFIDAHEGLVLLRDCRYMAVNMLAIGLLVALILLTFMMFRLPY